jgi:hypothetical protein
MTFTTTPFERSSSWRFEAPFHKVTPRDLPSSLPQHRVSQRVLDTRWPQPSERIEAFLEIPTRLRAAFADREIRARYTAWEAEVFGEQGEELT